MAKRDDPYATRWQDWLTWISTPVGMMIVAASFVALIVAGVTVADVFVASPSDPQADLGVAAATQSWATSLGQLGVAVLFGIAIIAALARIRVSLEGRRRALVAGLPTLVRSRAKR